MKEIFRKIAAKTAYAMGTASAFLIATLLVVVWAFTGPIFNYSDTWQLYINTSTTVATFLMVFLIQNTQNRDSKALHLKLDELIRSTKSARNAFVDLENFTDEDLELLDREFKELHIELQDNASIRKLRKTIAAEKERRNSFQAAGDAITSLMKNPLGSISSKNNSKK